GADVWKKCMPDFSVASAKFEIARSLHLTDLAVGGGGGPWAIPCPETLGEITNKLSKTILTYLAAPIRIFPLIILIPKTVIPTGGTALFAVPERRNLSTTLDFKFT